MNRTLLVFLIALKCISVRAQTPKIKVFLSCNCDYQYIIQNTQLFDYVRDRTLSDIEVFIFDIRNASGGIKYSIEFKGKNEFNSKENKISTDISQNLTLKESRDALLKTYKLGMVFFLQNTPFQEKMEVTFDNYKDPSIEPLSDQWKNWIFEVSGSFNFQDEKSINEKQYNLAFEIDRVTEKWRVRSDIGFWRSVKFFKGEEENYSSERERSYLTGSIVRSISNHFSTGIFGSFETDTYTNYKSFYNFSPALEYNLIPYKEVLTREVTFAYKIGYNLYEYFEETLYGFNKQNLFNQSLTLNVRFREKWGNIYSYLVASQFIDQPDLRRLTLNNNLNLRVFRGLSVRLSGSFQLIRDQINLPKGETSIEDLLLRQRQISTDYQNRISLGLSYTFGSIFNNIVNTRL